MNCTFEFIGSKYWYMSYNYPNSYSAEITCIKVNAPYDNSVSVAIK